MTELYWDPYDTVIDTNPYPVWHRMRDEVPVYVNERFGFYALSRFADVDDAHLDPATFSSAYGTVLEIMGDQPYDNGMIIFTDPPSHTMMRVLVSRGFTPRRIAVLEDHIRTLCGQLLDQHVGGSGFDFVQEFSAILPSMVISELIGVEPADREEVRRLIDRTFYIDPEKGMVNDISFGAQIELHEIFRRTIDARRESPRDDVMTALTEATIKTADGTRKLTTKEATDFTNLLVSAGTETVARLLGWACALLAEHPEQRAALAADPSLLTGAVEETLRYEAPSPVQGRTTTREIELHGVTIPAHSKVLLLTAAANRDERKYADPDTYDIRRKFDSHVSFGHGPHFCLGASLARMEGRVALEEVLKRFPTWEIDHDNVHRLHTSTVRGYEKLPILL